MKFRDTHLRCPRCQRPIMQQIVKRGYQGLNTDKLQCGAYWCDYLEDQINYQQALAELTSMGFVGDSFRYSTTES